MVSPPSDQKRVLYVFAWVSRIGEVAHQLFCIRAICQKANRPLTIITPAFRYEQTANPYVMEIMLRGLDHVMLPGHDFDNEVKKYVSSLNEDVLLFPPYQLYQLQVEFRLTFQHEKPQFISLNAGDHRRGMALRQLLGIPAEAKTVVLHVRESGYLEKQAPRANFFSYHDHRDANIMSYLPAIEYLTSQGYYVIRIGDNSMRPLPKMDQVIDAPHIKNYHPFIDLYFCAVSDFLLGMGSGPFSLALALGTPVLITNCVLLHLVYGFERDIFLYKKYFARTLNRYLTFEEILMSQIAEFLYAEEYEECDIELHDNTPEDLLYTTQEMVQKLRGEYKCELESQINARIQIIKQKANYIRAGTDPKLPYSGQYLSRAKVSTEYYKRNLDLIGTPLPMRQLYTFYVNKVTVQPPPPGVLLR